LNHQRTRCPLESCTLSVWKSGQRRRQRWSKSSGEMASIEPSTSPRRQSKLQSHPHGPLVSSPTFGLDLLNARPVALLLSLPHPKPSVLNRAQPEDFEQTSVVGSSLQHDEIYQHIESSSYCPGRLTSPRSLFLYGERGGKTRDGGEQRLSRVGLT